MKETERLYLKKPDLTMINDLYTLCKMKEVNLYNPEGEMKDRKEAETLINQWINDWKIDRGYYMLYDKLDNQFVGYCGVRGTLYENKEVYNLAYRIHPMYWRQGFVYDLCFRLLNQPLTKPVIVRTLKENIASRKLAEKLGFKLIKEEKQDVYYLYSSKQRLF